MLEAQSRHKSPLSFGWLLLEGLLLWMPSLLIWHPLPTWSWAFFTVEDVPFLLGMGLGTFIIWRARGSWSSFALVVGLFNIVVFWISVYSCHQLLHQRPHFGGYRESFILSDISSLWNILFVVSLIGHAFIVMRHSQRKCWSSVLLHIALMISQGASLYYSSALI